MLLLVVDGPEGPDILLIQRSSKGLGCTPASPLFPGGGVDPGDDGPIGAALREAREETGLDPSGVEAVVGTMPELYVWRSDNRVTPRSAGGTRPAPWHARVSRRGRDRRAGPGRSVEPVDPANRLRLRHPRGIVPSPWRSAYAACSCGDSPPACWTAVPSSAALFERPLGPAHVIEDLPPEVLDLAVCGAEPGGVPVRRVWRRDPGEEGT